MRYRGWIPVGFLALALTAAACGSTSSPSASSAGASATAKPASSSTTTAVLKTEKTSSGTALANSKGYTVYWFSKDTSTSSACTGACASKWPPVLGKPQAAAGTSLTGTLGTITRSNGQVQATYNGHPLYTFVGDTAPGQTSGNLLNVFGGVWYTQTVSGGGAATPSPSSSSSSSGYGSGY